MLTYNTHLKPVTLPGYGRNIQQMVDHCLTIEDRDERTRCARTIVRSMLTLHPEVRQEEDWEQKLWDHLAIMSRFELDIDWPVEVISEAETLSTPDKIAYPTQLTTHRNYGKGIQRMISRAARMEPGEERDALVLLLANQMKKLMLGVNKDHVTDSRIFKDLAAMSHGEFVLNPEEVRLAEYNILPPPSTKKKKKK